MKFPKIHQQIISLGILIFMLLAVFIVARNFFVPPSFGLYGHYRAKAVDENREKEIKYAGSKNCADCHDDIYNLKAKSYHKDVSCEVCHGPAAEHADDPSESVPKLPHNRDSCTICHNYNLARPTGFPQIITDRHNPGKFCTNCHKAHNPMLPHIPEDCSACHREIANQKMVSHHASLDCVTCHPVQPEHLTDRKSTRLNSSHIPLSRMPSSA